MNMKAKILTILVWILTCISMTCYGQTGEKQNQSKPEPDYLPHHEIIHLKELNISLNLAENWKVKKIVKSKSVELKHINNSSTITIFLTDSKAIITEILEKSEKQNQNQGKDVVSPEMIVALLQEFDSLPNGSVKISSKSSETIGEYELISGVTVSNSIGFTSNAKIEVSCDDCKTEFEFMINSIQKLK
jgi:hypothetical protein